MTIISWLIFGTIAGWIASLILKTDDQQGVIGNVIVGIIGAALGGWLADLMFNSQGVTGFNIKSFIVAIIGAVVFLLIKGVITGKRAV